MATLDVKIPPDWLRTPNFANRTELLDARKHERRALGLAIEGPASCEKQFARTDKVFRDTYRPSGAFVRSPRQQEFDLPQHWHPRATCSGAPTKSALLSRRQNDKRLESLKFEPPEIERLKDIPKVDQLADWWKRPRPGYVEDPASADFFKHSLRLELANRGGELVSLDPAKTRSATSVDERRHLHEKRGQLADKVTHISHLTADEFSSDGPSVAARAVHAPGVCSAGRIPAEAAWPVPISPITVHTKRKKAPRKAVENLVLESTSQRVLLDQFKSCQLLAPPALSVNGNTKEGTSGAPLSPIIPSSVRSREGFRSSIRCGGFS